MLQNCSLLPIPSRPLGSFPRIELHRPQASRHIVQFYENDRFIIENVSFLAANSLRNGDSSVLIATGPHLNRIDERLSSSGFDLREIPNRGRYIALDAAESSHNFWSTIGPTTQNLTKSSAKLSATRPGKARMVLSSRSVKWWLSFALPIGCPLLCVSNSCGTIWPGRTDFRCVAHIP
jgi:hypothetical protein